MVWGVRHGRGTVPVLWPGERRPLAVAHSASLRSLRVTSGNGTEVLLPSVTVTESVVQDRTAPRGLRPSGAKRLTYRSLSRFAPSASIRQGKIEGLKGPRYGQSAVRALVLGLRGGSASRPFATAESRVFVKANKAREPPAMARLT